MPLEPADFTRLYRRHASSLLVFFQRRACDPEAATDLLADTFAIAIERADQFRGSGDRAGSGWLWQIAGYAGLGVMFALGDVTAAA